jgi:hypothetical protein
MIQRKNPSLINKSTSTNKNNIFLNTNSERTIASDFSLNLISNSKNKKIITNKNSISGLLITNASPLLDHSYEIVTNNFLTNKINPYKQKNLSFINGRKEKKYSSKIRNFSFYNQSFLKYENDLRQGIKTFREKEITDGHKIKQDKLRRTFSNFSHESEFAFINSPTNSPKYLIQDIKKPIYSQKINEAHKREFKIRQGINKSIENERKESTPFPMSDTKQNKTILKKKIFIDNKFKIVKNLKQKVTSLSSNGDEDVKNKNPINSKSKILAMPEAFQINGALTFPQILGDSEMLCSLYNQNLSHLKRFLNKKAKEKFDLKNNI